MDDGRLRRITGRQKGLFTYAQARACGYSPFQIRSRVAAGRWVVIRARVLAEAGVRLTPHLADRAAQLAVPGSVLAGLSAARMWGLGLPDGHPQLLIRRRPSVSVAGIRVRLTDTLDRRDVQVFDGALITSRERTVVDCLMTLSEPQSVDLLDRALQQQWIDQDDLTAWCHRFAGRRGVDRLRRLRRMATGGTRFAAERLLAQLLVEGGIAGWETNLAIHDDDGLIGVGDFVFRQVRLVVEADGWAYHVTPDRFQRDRHRQNRLIAAGWVVLRFTWRDLIERPTYVIGMIRDMLDRLARRKR